MHAAAARYSTAEAAVAAYTASHRGEPTGPEVPLEWALASADAADRKRERATTKRRQRTGHGRKRTSNLIEILCYEQLCHRLLI